MKYRYPIKLAREKDGGYVVTFPDFPEAITQGDSLEQALHEAADCLSEALAGRVNDDQPVPPPSPVVKFAVEPTAQIAAKVALFQAFKDAGVNKVGLAKRMALGENEVRRMLDPYHATKLSRIEEVLAVLGKRLRIDVVDASDVVAAAKHPRPTR